MPFESKQAQGGSKLERARDLFEQALEKCPAKSCKALFLMYAKLEEDFGLVRRSMSIFDRATQVVADEDKFEVRFPGFDYLYTLYLFWQDVRHLHCKSHG